MPFRIIHYWKDVCKKVVLKDTKQNQLTKKVPLQQICHKKRFTATTYKEIAETTFCRRSQQEQKFATWSRATIIKQDVVKTNKVSQKCCLLWERNVLKIWKKKNSNKVVRKDNLQKSYQKRPFAKNDKNKVNRCLARYSPRATTTNRPINRALNKPGPNWPKMPVFGQIWSFLGKKSFFLLEKSKVLLPT